MRPALGHGHYDSDGYSSEDADENSCSASRHSSIFQANLYFVEDPDQPLSSIAGHTYSQVRHETGILSTSVDSSTTLVPNAVDTASDPADFENGDLKTEPLCVYTSPMEPTERPPPMPAPPAQKRAEALAEILFRQGGLSNSPFFK
ncbi:hypothetical protein AOL_s00078g32 [Orbilia oligospora ATCC 24927]|uniref:Uncharacterized protein n=1 Tax=Arthrobotrys oligospora (strain ATCC 24927 / CBS 115.81 / DSM 1491) TaxID=756982 RepID=G1XAT5_ARTOA|nr:hypothetical protein AOL_s00078g32 [Orbilia oligospora ATCC 24927]EGX49543.1 hypothetical protein AOL_s00078g32 [Orbilia oligospora ATCC 24927]